jgi:hypothetical protein
MNPDLDPRLRLLGVGVGVVLIAGYLVAFAGAYAAQPWVVFGAVLAIHAAEPFADRNVFVRPVLRRAQMGPAARSILRDAAVLMLVANDAWATGNRERDLARAVAIVVLARFATLLLNVVVRRRVQPALEVRNLGVPQVGMPRPAWLYDDDMALRLHYVTAVAALGVTLAVAVHNEAVGLVSCWVTDAALAVLSGLMLTHLVQSRRHPQAQFHAAVEAAVETLAPRLMLYFSGTADSSYQLTMWLSTLERLGEPSVVVLRERVHMRQLPETSVPVVCVPAATDFMAFGWRSIRVAAYVANVGKNIHMLRERGVRHVFIGHGDSDKTGSFSPFSKVYSEIWVAGPAGRERYLRARVGIRDDEIVEVGRPQLVGMERGRPIGSDDPMVVLYAPTWEGWPGDPPHSSLANAGERIIAGLLATPKVRVVYKPHPLTGTVSPAARAGNDRVIAMLGAAGGDHTVVTGSSPSLYECFNQADVLVGDISSVVTEFLASEKPYLMANLHDLPDEQFRTEFASAAGAYLLRPDGAGVEAALAAIRAGDPLRADRVRTRRHLLGDGEPGDIRPFEQAIDAAAAAAAALWPDRAELAASTLD